MKGGGPRRGVRPYHVPDLRPPHPPIPPVPPIPPTHAPAPTYVHARSSSCLGTVALQVAGMCLAVMTFPYLSSTGGTVLPRCISMLDLHAVLSTV